MFFFVVFDTENSKQLALKILTNERTAFGKQIKSKVFLILYCTILFQIPSKIQTA